MTDICLYFEVHQPFRVGQYDIFQVGQRHDFIDDTLNARLMRRIADKCYLPANALLLRLIKAQRGQFRVAFSISGVAIEQMELYAPDALASFKALVATGAVELLAETYHHSLASQYDLAEFRAQVAQHAHLMRTHFGVEPRVFRNTELIYDDALGAEVSRLGYDAMLVEGADDVLAGLSPDFVYAAAVSSPGLALLPKNYRLSDDIAFRFTDRSAPGYPLTAQKFAASLAVRADRSDTINLFMDYETFGEHHWQTSGIFTFLEQLPAAVLARPELSFRTPSEVWRRHASRGMLAFPRTVSWADKERDVSAWDGNDMQRAALRRVFALIETAKAAGDVALLAQARRMTTSDHFYYMSTKGFADGEVHAYFSPFENPYEAFINYMNALSDLEKSVEVVRESMLPPAAQRVASPALSA